MTFGEGKRKVLMLIDEYSSGGTISEDRDIDLKMADFFDLAQKNIAQYKKIVRSTEIAFRTPEAGESGYLVYDMPDNFAAPFRVWRGTTLTKKYPWRTRQLLAPAGETGKVTVEYFAVPATITGETPDDHEFEVTEDAAACMPYFVAAQQLVVDLVVDYSALLNTYDRMLAALDLNTPGSGGGGIRQALYQ